jgi:hypothetical protein
MEEFESTDFEFTEEFEGETGTPLTEIEEMEQAAALLEITDEAELDQFIGNLSKGRAARLDR